MDRRSANKAAGERVYQAIKARVIAYEFPQGERIYLEPIADELGVSTWPVRHVFDSLAAEGLVIKAPRKGFYALTLREDDVMGHYQRSRHLLSLGLETLKPTAVRKLPHCEPIAAVLTKLNRRALSDGNTLAAYTGEIFARIAALTEKSVIVLAIDRANDHLYYIRTLECQRLQNVQDELTCFCELLLAGDRNELISVIKDYHERRIELLPALLTNC